MSVTRKTPSEAALYLLAAVQASKGRAKTPPTRLYVAEIVLRRLTGTMRRTRLHAERLTAIDNDLIEYGWSLVDTGAGYVMVCVGDSQNLPRIRVDVLNGLLAQPLSEIEQAITAAFPKPEIDDEGC